jgi:hypothetical protein
MQNGEQHCALREQGYNENKAHLSYCPRIAADNIASVSVKNRLNVL